MSTRLGLAASLLAACSPPPDLSGTWEGDLTCEQGGLSADYTVRTILPETLEGVVRGPITIAFREDFPDPDGSVLTIAFEAAGQLTLDVEKDEPQDLAAERTLDTLTCEILRNGVLASTACADASLSVDRIDDDTALDDLSWDGADSIELASDDCSGELER